MQFGREAYDCQAVFGVLSEAMRDSKDRVRLVAVEGLAALHSRMGRADFERMLSRSSLSEDDKQAVRARLENPMLCCINADGLVEHVADVSGEDSGGRGEQLAQGLGPGAMSGTRIESEPSCTCTQILALVTCIIHRACVLAQACKPLA